MAAGAQPLQPHTPGGTPDPGLWEMLGWHPARDQLERLVALQQELRQWNSRLNLTRLVEGDDYWITQVFDSLWPLVPLIQAVEREAVRPPSLIDVGTGGGFPGLAVAIALPTARLTLVDSVGRKIEAVRAMAAAIGLEERLSLRCERIERTGRSRDCRGRFDWALARAVAAAPVVAEYLMPLLVPGGRALLYRGQWSAADQSGLERALAPLRAGIEAVLPRQLPGGRGLRHAVLLRAEAACPAAYPRAVGLPAKLPLGGDGPLTPPAAAAPRCPPAGP